MKGCDNMAETENAERCEFVHAHEEIVAKVCDNRIAADRLDKSYLDRFKKILSNKKIFLVQRAEMRFHREMLKGMNRKDGGNDPKRKK